MTVGLRSAVLVAAFVTVIGMTAAPIVDGSPAAGAAPRTPETRAVTTVNPCLVPDGTVAPTPGFDPMTASDAELRARDFPTRPRAGEPGMDAWKQYVRWHQSGKVYRCGTPQVIQDTGISFGRSPARARP